MPTLSQFDLFNRDLTTLSVATPQSGPLVPNEFCRIPSKFRLAIIGKSPDKHDLEVRRPLVAGYNSALLWPILANFGVRREHCFIGHVSQKEMGWTTDVNDHTCPNLQEYLDQLHADLVRANPNLVLLLGNGPLHCALVEDASAFSWRGSLFCSTQPSFMGFKCMCTYAPRDVMVDYNGCIQLFRFDLKRAVEESQTPVLTVLERTLDTSVTFNGVCDHLDRILASKCAISLDIETTGKGTTGYMTCLSIATSATESFIIPFAKLGVGGSYWPLHKEVEIWLKLQAVLLDATIPKILQNSLYDNFYLSYIHRIPILGVADDTMLKHWELFAEMEKSLDVQASIYTKQAQWKHNRKAIEAQTLWSYCCTDSSVTYEINEVLKTQLKEKQSKHYQFNVDLLPMFLYMELQGIRYNASGAKVRLDETQQLIYQLQGELNRTAGLTPPRTIEAIKAICCLKRATCTTWQDLCGCPLKGYTETIHRIVSLAQLETLTLAEEGELSMLLGVHLNVDSSKQMCEFLYQVRGYDIQYKKVGREITGTQTADANALLALYLKNGKDELLKKLLILRGLLTSLDSLSVSTDKDSRIRCAYNVVGSETGRITCYTSPTGSGMNLQTVTKKHRPLYRADDGYDLANYDLAGADGWTVAAYCAMLGDRTMLDDYLFGLKPARIIALMQMYGIDACDWSRDVLKERGKEVKKDGWLYFACKRVYHGTDYGLGPDTCSVQIVKDSYKLTGEPIYVDVPTCTSLRAYTLKRYPGINRWHAFCQQRLRETGTCVACSGNTRIFFGRRNDHKTIMAYYAHEPQHNTTYATNLAARNLWFDPENRDGNALIIRPLHQVHDALMCQWPKERRAWAIAKMATYFANELLIAGQKITIPYEGNFGPAWEEWEGSC